MYLNIAIIGLLLDVVGVLTLWFTGDYLTRQNIMSQSTSTTGIATFGPHSFVSGVKTLKLLKKKYLNQLSLIFLVVGFICQIAGYYVNASISLIDFILAILALLLSIFISYWLLGRRFLLHKTIKLIRNSNTFKGVKLNGDNSFILNYEIAKVAQNLKIGRYPENPDTSEKIERYVQDVLAWRGGL